MGSPERIRRCCRAAAFSLAVLTLVAPALARASDDLGARPGSYDSRVFAAAIHVVASPVPPPFVAEVVRADLPEGTANWDSGGSAAARGSTLYPGVGVTQGPTLLCTFGLPCSAAFPPPWPFSADAQYPSTPDAAVSSGQSVALPGLPGTVTAGKASAHAGQDRVTTDATGAGFRLGGSPAVAAASLDFRRTVARLSGTGRRWPSARTGAGPTDGALVAVDGLTAVTRQAFEGGVLVARAEARLSGVDLVGGVIHVDTILATSTAATDGDRVVRNDSRVVVSGVTVAGTPATIDERGVTVGGGGPQARPLVDQLNAALRQALHDAGAQVFLLGATRETGRGRSQGVASGVLVTADAGNPGVPGPVNAVTTTAELGHAGSLAVASGPPGVLPPGLSLPGASLGTGDAGGIVSAAVTPGGSGPSPTPGAPGPGASPGGAASGERASVAPARPRARAARARGPDLLLLDAAAAHRTTSAALAGVLALAGMAVGLRLPTRSYRARGRHRR